MRVEIQRAIAADFKALCQYTPEQAVTGWKQHLFVLNI
jgi:hypothetical protein